MDEVRMYFGQNPLDKEIFGFAAAASLLKKTNRHSLAFCQIYAAFYSSFASALDVAPPRLVVAQKFAHTLYHLCITRSATLCGVIGDSRYAHKLHFAFKEKL